MNKHLQQFLSQENFMRSTFFKLPPYDPVRDKQELLNRIDNHLSPENLTCDGELSGIRLKQKFQMLTGAQKALQSL
jgi:hypothetical protein